ncbi:MAG: response regulator [Candidatus Omnitrophota bacterium]
MMATEKKTKRILIVEDDEDMLEIYRGLFKSKSDRYEIETVTDARMGFKKLEEQKYDLVILDIIMEPMPGDTFFLCVRNDDRVKNVPILVVSVLDPEDLSRQFNRVNHADYLQKPITEEQLFDKIENIIVG